MASATTFGTWTEVAGDPSLPAPAPPPPGSGYHISGGQIIAPSGAVFIGKGFAVLPDGNTTPKGSVLKTQMPGANFINWAAGQLNGGGYTNFNPPDPWYSQIDDFLANGFMVMISDYTPGQPTVRTGGDAQGAFNWYAAIAAHYKTQPNVCFTTQNEAYDDGKGGMDAYHRGVYNAVRNAGSNALIFFEIANGNPGNLGGLNSASYSNMSNVGWNIHVYPWEYGSVSKDQGSFNNYVLSEIAHMQAFTRSADGVMPVIMGEGGNASDGNNIDDYQLNGKFGAVESFLECTRTAAGGFSAFAAWLWNYNNEGTFGADMLSSNGTTVNTAMGSQVQARCAQVP